MLIVILAISNLILAVASCFLALAIKTYNKRVDLLLYRVNALLSIEEKL